MLNHWGTGGVLVFNLVENADLRQPPRKKEKKKKHLYLSFQHFGWLQHWWPWLSQQCDLNRAIVSMKCNFSLLQLFDSSRINEDSGIIVLLWCSHLNNEKVTRGFKLASGVTDMDYFVSVMSDCLAYWLHNFALFWIIIVLLHKNSVSDH